ncbi:hypothetical protein [Iningainema tapete]|uniref:Uncharacterized protein n=1 Tax=Iningainema tapete BLCC-T55 TaxID=2748662 RepID=A0A8J6XFW4_9CYAN|nr:hypothetical protein [Iningainema tapete]MBD2771792.1 hypothetical protein [Iningainema tapete BLCC-T55]
MNIFDLTLVEDISDVSAATIAGGYAEFYADADADAVSAGPNAIALTDTSGFAIRGETGSSAKAKSTSRGFASITTPVPARVLG